MTMQQQWLETREPLPAALAGLGATPVHYDDAWWVQQPERLLVYPTGVGKSLRWPGVSGIHASPSAQRWALAADPRATPDAQRWALAGDPQATPSAQKWSGVGDAAAFTQAATDLHNQLELPIQAGDTYLQAGDAASALSAYKAAGQVGAGTLGPEIDAAGAPSVTQSYTQYAWGLNGQLAAATDATAAQGLVHEMLVTYQDAIQNGALALNAAPSGGGGNAPSSDLLAKAQALKAYLDTNGVPSRHTKLQVTGDFQRAFIADGNTLKYGADSEYGPATAAALAAVLGSSPAPKPPAPGPGPGPITPPKPAPVTPSTAGSGDYTGPILIGAGVLAASIVAVAVYKRRRRAGA